MKHASDSRAVSFWCVEFAKCHDRQAIIIKKIRTYCCVGNALNEQSIPRSTGTTQKESADRKIAPFLLSPVCAPKIPPPHTGSGWVLAFRPHVVVVCHCHQKMNGNKNEICNSLDGRPEIHPISEQGTIRVRSVPSTQILTMNMMAKKLNKTSFEPSPTPGAPIR